MLINRSLPVAVLPFVVILLQFTSISPSPPPRFPVHRRTSGFVDHLIRANPLRALSNYLGRKLSFSVYYPPPPPHRQQFQPQPPLQQIVYVPGGIPPPAPPQSTHYVKLPVYLGQNVAIIPPVNPPSQFNIVSQPNYQQVQQPPQPQQYFLHGISYPVSVPPPTQYFIPQHQTFMQPGVSSYQPPVVTQATSVQQVQPQQAPITYVPQTSILVDEQHKVVQQNLQYPYSLGSNIQTESSPSQAVDNSFGVLPTLVNSAFEINEDSPSLNPHVSPNVQIDGFEDASSAGDMLKIFVIRPKDMERLKSSTEEERNELAKEYSMKYVDLEQGAQELSLDSSGELRNENDKNSQDDLHTQKDETSCIEPLCDSFLQKLIPQLLQSARNGKDDDDPIVIVKNNSHITTINENPFLQNHRLVDLEVSQETNNDNDDGPQFTVMKAVEGVEGHTTEEIFEGQHSTLKPQRVKVHFPRKKLLSAKISSAALRRKQTQSSQPAVKSNETNSSNDNFSRNVSLIPKPRNLQIDEVTYPRYKYRTARSRNLEKQRNARAGDFNERKDNNQGKTLVHYAGGVIFNNDLKVST